MPDMRISIARYACGHRGLSGASACGTENRPDVVPGFKQVRGEGVPKRMTRGRPRDAGGPRRLLHRTLQHSFVQMMPAPLAGRRIPRRSESRETPTATPTHAARSGTSLEARPATPRCLAPLPRPPHAVSSRVSNARPTDFIAPGSIVTRSFPPLPSQTTSSARSKVTSFTRNSAHSLRTPFSHAAASPKNTRQALQKYHAETATGKA